MNTQTHTLKVGDILKSSWGYDQTNIDYFQVVKLIGKTMVGLRAINGEMVESTSWASGKVRPVKDSFRRDFLLGGDIDTVYRRKASKYKGYVSIDNVRLASIVETDKADHFSTWA